MVLRKYDDTTGFVAVPRAPAVASASSSTCPVSVPDCAASASAAQHLCSGQVRDPHDVVERGPAGDVHLESGLPRAMPEQPRQPPAVSRRAAGHRPRSQGRRGRRPRADKQSPRYGDQEVAPATPASTPPQPPRPPHRWGDRTKAEPGVSTLDISVEPSRFSSRPPSVPTRWRIAPPRPATPPVAGPELRPSTS